MPNTVSSYAAKKMAGKQMYGPGCCAHRITSEQIASNRRRVAQRRGEGRYIPPGAVDAAIKSFMHWEGADENASQASG